MHKSNVREVERYNASLYHETCNKLLVIIVFNPPHTCAVRVTVVFPCVCLCVCVSEYVCVCVCLFVVLCHNTHVHPKILVPTGYRNTDKTLMIMIFAKNASFRNYVVI